MFTTESRVDSNEIVGRMRERIEMARELIELDQRMGLEDTEDFVEIDQRLAQCVDIAMSEETRWI